MSSRGAPFRWLIRSLGAEIRLVSAEVRIDHREFEEAYRAGIAEWQAGRRKEAVQAFRRGTDLYTGDLFHEPALQEAFDVERHRCRLRAVRMQELEAGDAFERGAFENARAIAERLLEIDPTHEEAHRILMRIYRKFGQEDLLARQFRLCERLLRQHLDVEPSEETRNLAATGS
jgi:DNA-binding SARP family transcriptional activator